MNSISAEDLTGIYPLTSPQREIWFDQAVHAHSSMYNIGGYLRIVGALDPQRFEQAINLLIRKHDCLRTVLIKESGSDEVPMQTFAADMSVRVPLHDFTQVADPHASALTWMQARFDEPFSLHGEPLTRHDLLKVDSNVFYWLLQYHHIIVDGWSIALLCRSLAEIYSALEKGVVPDLTAQSYVEFIKDDRGYVEGHLFKRQRQYWLEKYRDPPDLLLKPRYRQAGHEPVARSVCRSLSLPRSLYDPLTALAKSSRSTVFHVILAALYVYFVRNDGRGELVIGLPVLNRAKAADRATAGLFVGVSAVRFDFGTDLSFTELLRNIARVLKQDYRHQRFPVSELNREVGLRHTGRQQIFDLQVSYERHDHNTMFGTALGRATALLNSSQPTALTLFIREFHDGEDVALDFVYNCAYFQREEIDAIQRRLLRVLSTVVGNLDIHIERIPLVTSEDIAQLQQWNATQREYPQESCIHELFEAQVERTPEAVAVVCEEQSLSYGQLNAQANCLARHLEDLGVGPEVRVAICAERGIQLVVGVLATLKAGGAYVPLDPAYPSERLSYLLQDSGAVVLLHAFLPTALPGRLQEAVGTAVALVDLCADVARWASRSGQNLDRQHSGEGSQNLAYVIYTSGSTGEPKGVMVEHRGVCNLVRMQQRLFKLQPGKNVLQFASLAFDASVWEWGMALCAGATLILASPQQLMPGAALLATLQQRRITHVTLPPAVLAVMPEKALLEELQVLVVAGESCGEREVSRWAAGREFFNAYGPTEATVCASVYRCESREGSPPAIGRPIANVQMYILDNQRQPVPIGVTGEIYIGGAGVARGYLNRPQLTMERFVEDPFRPEGAGRLYRTGDLGRWRMDGNIEFLGRNDQQVKMRGFRIELGEIEGCLQRQPGIREAVVLARENEPGEKRLVAYVVSESGPLDVGRLREQLSRSLPQYMLPVAYVQLEGMPLTANGKLDRRALPAPKGAAFAQREYEEPQGMPESALAQMWAELLGVERVGRQDHFFELGGHSLLAVQLLERMRRQGLYADVRTLFTQPTLAGLAQAVRQAQERGWREVVVPPNGIGVGCEVITPSMLPLIKLSQEQIDQIVRRVPGGTANVQDIYPLAPLQEGILFHHLLQQGDAYLAVAMLSFARREWLDEFVQTLQQVITRHDVLRTAVLWEGLPEPVQVVWREAVLAVEEVQPDPAEGEIAEQLLERFDPRRVRMDVRQAPLMSLAIAWDGPKDRWVMLLRLHHLAVDHTGLEIIRQEVQAYLLGREQELPPPQPFRNFVAQARLGVSKEEHEEFFRQMLGDVHEPTAPYGLLQVHGDGSDVLEEHQMLETTLAQRIRRQARQLGVSAASIFHWAWAQVLGRTGACEDVVFGTVLLGRMYGGEGSDRALGIFINTLPIRIRLGEVSVVEGIRSTHETLAQLMRHEHASLALAQRCSGLPGHVPLFSALLNYRHSVAEPAAAAEIAPGGMQVLSARERTNYPCTLSVDDLGGEFALSLQVVPPLQGQRLCRYMHQALGEVVRALERAPFTPAWRIGVLDEAERQQLLVQWNATQREYPRDCCIHELFEAQVERTPEAVAVVCEEESLSYGQLNAQANRLARHLEDLGVGPEVRVGICAERGLQMVLGMLATLKAGGAYVPLDPAYPSQRLIYTLQDSGAVVLLHASVPTEVPGRLQEAAGIAVALVDLCADVAQWASRSGQNLDRQHNSVRSRNLAYVIYTSGSSGQPKGVMVEHANVARLFSATQEWFHFDSSDVWTLFHSCAFDFSVWEMWGALLHGGRLVVVPSLISRSPQEFYALVCAQGVTVLNQTPNAFRQFIGAQAQSEKGHRLRYVICGGEALEVGMLGRWYERSANGITQLINMYGITETTVHVTYRPLQVEDTQRLGASPIGKRIPDLRVYVLDRRGEPVPLEVVGEIYIGGPGVARGYLNRPELTAERFVKDPFSGKADARMYRTGDLGRYLEDGSLEYLGRTDTQVKIRGFRIELGEIEGCLQRQPGIREAVVLARENEPGEKRLVAYVVSESGLLDVGQLREQLSRSLPQYMLPVAYVQLERMPLTANGKLDRRALPAPDQDAVAMRQYAAPVGKVEEAIAGIWQELLGLACVGRNDHFFELGGHSLLAVQLMERMRRQGLYADVRTLFTQPTLAGLAQAVRQAQERGWREVVPPPNGIEAGCEAITPAMLPLVKLSQEQIDRIVQSVPGGAANVQDIYPLAPLQEGILFHHLLQQQGDVYLLVMTLSFTRREWLDEFVQTLQQVITRHDVLRTAMLWEGLPEPVQVVWREAVLAVEEVQPDPAEGEIAEQLLRRFDPRRVRMDVRQAPLMSLAIARDGPKDRWVMLLRLHHLAVDHTGMEIIRQEVQAYLLGREQELPPPQPFRNFVAQARLGVSKEEHEEFFRQMLGDVYEPTAPYGLLQVHGDGSDVLEDHQMLETTLAQRIRRQARQLGVSAASIFHWAWARVLGRTGACDDVVFGTVLLGRMHGGEGSDRALGVFINTLPIRIRLGEVSVVEGIRSTHETLAQLMRHEHASLALAQRCSGLPGRVPLFSALLNYRHSVAEPAAAAEIAYRGVQVLSAQERTNYPCTLSVDDLGGEFALSMQVVPPLQGQRLCRYMQQALGEVVRALERAPFTPAWRIGVLDEAERQQLLVQWNATQREYPRDCCIHELFEAQVERTPEAVAVVCEEQSLSYGQLSAQATRLARYLREQGVQPGSRVALDLERSAGLIIAQLAILKCGAVYVPLDEDAPGQRKAFMLADCAAAFVLSVQGRELPRLSGTRRIDLDRVDLCASTAQEAPFVAMGHTGSDVAYVMYTSGSTGQPKGIEVPHRAIARLVLNNGYADFAASDRVAFAANPAFDASTLEVWSALLNGGCSVVLDRHSMLRPQALRDLVREQRLSVLWLSVGLFNQIARVLPDAFGSLRYLIVGGDALDAHTIGQVLHTAPPEHLLNGYGPTETTTFAATYEIRQVAAGAVSVPIGRPIANTRIYLLDRHGEPVPLGVVGEIYIGGAGVARGYLNRPDLTAERFVKDPFSGEADARMFRTGDLAKYLPDGNLEYLGRTDTQVKIRGFRIELGEIERCLQQQSGIREAVVLARENELGATYTSHGRGREAGPWTDGEHAVRAQPNEKRLVAYVVSESGRLDVGQLREQLSRSLPEYMLPVAYVQLEKMPLTPNGKLDRQGLPAPDQDAVAMRQYAAPVGKVEEAIAGIWQELLGLACVGRNDHFFELGGHSLLAAQMIASVRAAVGIDLPLRVLFDAPTVAALAARIEHTRPQALATPEEIIPTQAQSPLPLSFAQQRFWFLDQYQPNNAFYSVSMALTFSGALDVGVLLRALNALIERHEPLRTIFAIEAGVPHQVILSSLPLTLPISDLSAVDTEAQEAHIREAIATEANTPFDLSRGPLIRARLLRRDAERHVLLLIVHHIVYDGWSTGVLLDELRQCYVAFMAGAPSPLAVLPVRYADYTRWEQRRYGDEHVEQDVAYWKAYLRNAPPLLALPTDRPRPAQMTHRGARYETRLPGELVQRLTALAHEHNATLFMVLTAAMNVLLHRYSGQEDLCIGVMSANRPPKTQGLIGNFINVLPLRTQLEGQANFLAVLRVTAGNLLAAYDRQLPYELLLRHVLQERSRTYTPYAQVVINFHNEFARPAPDRLRYEGLVCHIDAAHGRDLAHAAFDVKVEMSLEPGELWLAYEYNTDLFEAATIERWSGHYQALLEAACANPLADVRQINLLTPPERAVFATAWRETRIAYPYDKTIGELFDAQVVRTPDSVAVVDDGACCSYRELGSRADRLAGLLRSVGVGPDVLVGIYVGRSIHMVVGVLAVVKAGGAYVPLDPAYPQARLDYMLSDACPAVILTQTRLLSRLRDLKQRVVCIDAPAGASLARPRRGFPRLPLGRRSVALEAEPDGGDADSLSAAGSPDDLAYVIYTSGSTGRPKGSMVHRRGFANLLHWFIRQFDLGADDKTLLLSSFSFDLTQKNIFAVLLVGGQLHLPAEDAGVVIADRYIARQEMTYLNCAPSAFYPLLADGAAVHMSSLRQVFLGGEPIRATLIHEAYRDLTRVPLIHNTYGPTEASDVVSFQRWDPRVFATGVPIGSAISNTRLYVLDAHCNLLPQGTAGELYIGGDGVGRGYLNQPGLTAERFLPDPYSEEPGGRMYRTGDLVRQLANGSLEYLGRNDFQVKIRGLRIELGEIEAQLARCAGVREAVVLARENEPGEKRLVAYVVGESGPLDVGQLREQLSRSLPEYMLPVAYVQLEGMPLTANGKLDRRALPAPEGAAFAQREYAEPQGWLESALARIWSELLGVERVGRQDHFFELGGHSLLAVQLLARVRQRLGLEVSLQGLFAHPVLRQLAQLVSRAQRSELPPLQAMERPERLPLSFAQQRLWFIAQMDAAAGAAYHIPAGLRLHGRLDQSALQRALDRIVERHEVLRTHFELLEGQPVQRIAPASVGFQLQQHDLGEPDKEEQIRYWSHLEAHAAFDLQRGPLIRGRLLRLAEQEHVLLVTMHHIISDGWSLGILTRELSALYRAFSQGEDDPLPELSIQYADYAQWQRQWLTEQVLGKQLQYWQRHLQGAPELLELPTDRARPAVQSYRGASVNFSLGADLSADLKEWSRRRGATLYMSLHTGFCILLSRLSGQKDLVIGVPVANRSRTEVEGLIGFFVNTLALRVRVEDVSVRELLEHVKEAVLSGYAHQEMPFEQVVEALQPVRSLSHSPVFQVMLVMQNTPGGELRLPGLSLVPQGLPGEAAQFDLTLSVEESGEEIVGSFNYVSDLFDPETLERWVGYFRTILTGMVREADRKLSELRVMSEQEHWQVIEGFNATQTAYPAGLIHELFEEQVARTPETVAVEHEEQSLTYAELNQRANQLAWTLRQHGVGPEQLVGLCLERSVELAVGLLGVLKAGGAYVPLDPSYPAERLAYMLADAAPRVLLTQEHLKERLPDAGARIITLNTAQPQGAIRNSTENLRACELGLTPQHRVYVIYTSGSTGLPKGTAMAHRSMVNLIEWHRTHFRAADGRRVLQFAALSFDVAFQEVFSTLCSGGTLVLPDEWIRRDARALSEFLASRRIQRLFIPPLMLQSLAGCFQAGGALPGSLRDIITAGEQLLISPELTHFFQHLGGCRLHNHYGPTETHLVTALTLRGSPSEWPERPTIGQPISNSRMYVLDEQRQAVPIGVTGEIYIGGAGVARGYLNRPELTAERFSVDPFSQQPDARLYRSGDLGRWRADGSLEYLGRNDSQVKVRGYRIELGEIESQLRRHEQVNEAVVVARQEAPGEKRLVAYVTARAGAATKDEVAAGVAGISGSVDRLSVESLRAQLTASLPAYMVPSAFVVLERLPLTMNGKLDRRALPAPDRQAYPSQQYEAPCGEIEAVLAGIWQELLRVERVGRQDHFFKLGGHSLLAVQLLARVRQVLGRELGLRTLFERPTLQALAAQLSTAGLTRLAGIERADRTRQLPLSWGQQRLWFIAQLEQAGAAYHISAGVRLSGELAVTALQWALDRLVMRHEVLRTAFENEGGMARQKIAVQGSFTLQRIELTGDVSEREAQIHSQALEEARTEFDLSRGPLIRGRLLRVSGRDQVLLVTMHHIISDGWSMGILIRELGALYTAHRQGQPDPLPQLSIQYADYAQWQRQWLTEQVLGKQLQYWQRHLQGAPELLELPTDRARPAVQSYRGASVNFSLGADLSADLKEWSRRWGATLYMSLHAGFCILLSRLSGQKDLVIGVPVANRSRTEVEGLIGFFVNTLALRVRVEDVSVRELLEHVKETVLSGYAHQEVPFEQVVEALQPVRSLSHSPVFQVMLVMQNTPSGELRLPGLSLAPQRLPSEAAHFDLTLYVEESGGEIVGSFNYASDLFDPETLERWVGYFRTILTGMVREADRKLSELRVMSEQEHWQVIEGFNATQTAYPTGLIHELFEEQVVRTPQAIAVVCGEEQLTYEELNRRANQLAHYLVKRGIEADRLVGLCLAPSLELVIGVLGVLKAGGAYVPLEPSHPPERLGYILEDCAASWVLTQERIEPLLFLARLGRDSPGNARTVALDRDWGVIEPEEPGNPACRSRGVGAERLAYVMYTSGSTGQPKGVMVEHRNLVNYTYQAVQRFDVARGAGSLIGTSLGFDLALTGLYPPLVCGKSVRLCPDSQDLQALSVALLSSRGLAPVKLTPSHLTALLSLLPPRQLQGCVGVLVLGGEALTAAAVQRWWQADAGTRIFNHYGPTETTVGCVMHELDRTMTGSIPIGRPIANARIYILDEQREPVAIGVVGEIYIGGAGVARGYLNRPELTAERFGKDPFQPERSGGNPEKRQGRDAGQTVSAQRAHSRMYRSGDLGRWRADGTIEYLGRNDSQVKLRGFRVELGEIESRLGQHPQVSSCALMVREDAPGEKRLVAYYTGKQAVPSVEGLREHLRQRLPEHMVPSAFVRLEQLPLTANGKLDRKGLPAPDEGGVVRREYEEPQGQWERGIARIWQELLRVERVGRHENFFDLGGHSLLAARATSMMQNVLELDVSLRDLFQHPVLADLAQAVALHDQEESPQAIDFSKETALDCEIVTAVSTASSTTAPKHVLLTGATGFLGAFLLASLLEKTEATIHCLIRSGSEESARQRLVENLQSLDLEAKFIPQRVTVVPGDLGKQQLGLADAAFRRLAELIEVIYHNGAWVHALHPYETLRAVNVGGTKEIVRLAGTGRYKTLHYVSTIDAIVPDNSLQGSEQTDEPSLWRQFRSLPSGYAQSKWVSERVLNVARSRGISCTIYRPPYIGGSTDTGASNSTDLLGRLMDASFKVGCVPILERSINMVPVDYISDSIVHLSMRPDAVGGTHTLLHPQTTRLDQLMRCMVELHVPPLPMVEASEWLGRCAVDSDSEMIAAVMGSQQSSQEGWTEYPGQTIAGLAQKGLPWPPIDADLMRRCIAWRLRKASAS